MLMLRQLIDKKRRKGTTTTETRTTMEEPESIPWSDLNPLVLDRIREFLDSDLHDLRLRSVCRHWRASLSYPRRSHTESRFPIKLPSLSNKGRKHWMLNRNIVYRISPVEDPSHGWLIQSRNRKPNTFTLVDPFSNCRVVCRPNFVNASIDLRQFHLSELGNSYWIKGPFIKKVLFLLNFVHNVDFTVLVLIENEIYYCNNGDSAWTKVVTTQNHRFQDMIQFNGSHYAITNTGCLVSFNSRFQFEGVIPPLDHAQYSLARYKTDLFLLSEIKGPPKDLLVYKMVSGIWIRVENLGDIILVSRFDGEGLSVKDFKTYKGNCVYIVEGVKVHSSRIQISMTWLYDLDQGTAVRSMKDKLELGTMFWPPPSWICPYYSLVRNFQ